MKTPKYMLIASRLREAIHNGTYAKTGLLPIEKELCKEFEVSKITIKKAVDLLVAEGLVIKKQGSGTYINISNTMIGEESLASSSTSKLFGYAMSHPGNSVKIHIEKFDIIKAPEDIAQHLAINTEDFIYEIMRVRIMNDEPFVIEHTYMPVDLIFGINKEVLNDSVYAYITNVLKKRIDSSHEYVYADKSKEDDWRLLKIKESDPVTVLEQIVFLDNGIPFQYSVTRYKLGHFKYKGISKIEI